jgi:hypothetical protein
MLTIYRNEAPSPWYKFPKHTEQPDTVTVGEFLLRKLPNGNVLITNGDLEAMETDTKKLEALLKKYWQAEF